MSKAISSLKFAPIFLIVIGTFLIISSFFTNDPKLESQKSTKTDLVQPQVAGLSSEKTTQTESDQINKVTSKVTRVIDGDTIELESGQKVRYIGIDTPETVHPTKPVECFGHEASDKNKELVAGKDIQLEKDISETDKYGRLLRYVYIDGIFVNDYLVRNGFANSSSYPPDIKYQDQFRKAESEARQNNRGLWTVCSGETNDSGLSNQSTTIESGTNGCTIKGNISAGGKIYHILGQYYYNKTQIDESKGEKWFCTESEAISAGWRRSLK